MSLLEQFQGKEKSMKRPQKRRNGRQWAEIVSEHQSSGLSAKDFCKSRSISLANFYQWRKRLRSTSSDKEGRIDKKETFIEVGQIGATAVAASNALVVTLDFGEGVKLTLQRG
jgi:hypothetical protein